MIAVNNAIWIMLSTVSISEMCNICGAIDLPRLNIEVKNVATSVMMVV